MVLLPDGVENPCQSSAHAVELTVQVDGSLGSGFDIPLPLMTCKAAPFPVRLSPWWKALMELGITTSAEIGFSPTKVMRSATVAVEKGRGNRCKIKEAMEVVVDSSRRCKL